MTRKQAIACIRAAGAEGDRKAFMRLYVENRISLQVANEAWQEGQRFGAFVRDRDAKAVSHG